MVWGAVSMVKYDGDLLEVWDLEGKVRKYEGENLVGEYFDSKFVKNE